jgi:hypothetical protein
LQKKCPVYFSAIDQVISLSCAKNTSASFSAVAKKVHNFFYLCKKFSELFYQFLKVCKSPSVCNLPTWSGFDFAAKLLLHC